MSRRAAAGQAAAQAAISKTGPARKGPPPLADKKRVAAAAAAVDGRGSGAQGGNGQDGEDSDMSDDMLADALAQKLQAAGAAASKAAGAWQPPRKERRDDAQPPPLPRVRKEDTEATSDGKASAKSKAWGTPPPVRAKKGAEAAAADIAAKPKAKAPAPNNKDRAVAAAAAMGDALDAPPPLFDQWLACLKFLVGWNEAKPYDEAEVKGAFCEHLKEEGIESATVVDQLCATVVPLLLDVRRIDGAVVKNVGVQVLKRLKTVQVSILRVVAYELCRELDAKLALRMKKKAEGIKGVMSKPLNGAGATYLAGDIASLAKVVQHFRFDRNFSGGLHQLITSIRNQGRNSKNGGKVGDKKAQAKALEDGSVGSKKRKAAPEAKADGSEKAVAKKRARAES